MTENIVECPQCGYKFELSEIMTQQIKKQMEADFSERLNAQKNQIKEEERKKAKEELSIQMTDMQEALKEQQQKLEDFSKRELEFLRKKRELDEEKKQLELTVERKLEEAVKKTEKQTYQKFIDEHRQKDMEKDRKIQDLTRMLEDAKHKMEQGSMERQGEVLEEDLEKILIATFPFDSIEPVPKGVRGADVIHKVQNRYHQLCGMVLWEAKTAKNWSEKWVGKLKDDQRNMGADIAVIVSEALPKDVDNFALYNGIWVTSPRSALGLASALREQLVNVHFIKQSSEGKDEKMEALYNYLAGPEFKQKIEAIVEAFSSMQQQIEKERMTMEKHWQERYKQLDRIMKSTVGMYGEMRGIIGKSLPEIKKLELEAGDQVKRKTN